MRLGQLARKLEKKPQELVDYLANDHQISIDTDLNTKVEGEALDLILDTFQKEVEEEQPTEKTEAVVEATPETIAESEEVQAEEVVNEISEEAVEDQAAEAVVAEMDAEESVDSEEAATETIQRVGEDGEPLPELIVEGGVIKAPKPELDGPKVVGKIDLPEKKRSIQFLVTTNENTVDVTEAIFEKRKADKDFRKKKAIEARQQRKAKQQKKRKRKVMSDAEKKAHEAKIAAKRKAEIDKKRQESKRKHYFENVQKKTEVQSKQKKKKEIEKAAKKQKAPKQPEPTTLWGKFKRWLNT